MTDIFNIEAEILRARRRNLLKGQSEIVILGDGRGTQKLEDGLHRLWVRWPGNVDEHGSDALGVPFTVLAGSANYLCERNQQVYIKWVRGDYVIEGPDPVHMAATGRSMILLNPHKPENNYIEQGQLLSGLSSYVGELLINMQAWLCVLDDGRYIEYLGSSAAGSAVSQHQDLTPYRPDSADTHRYAVLVFNVNQYFANAEPLQVVVSTPIDIATALTPADIAEALATRADLSCKAIWAYRLEFGQTVGRPHTSDRDLRSWPQGPLTIPDDFVDGDMIAEGAITLPKFAESVLHRATVAPTVNDDSGDGYAAGSEWIDTAAKKAYVLLDATVGAAVWKETTLPTGAGTVTSVGVSSTTGKIVVSGSPVTGSGTIDLGIAANAITATEIAADAVTTSKINDTAVTAAKLATDSVTTPKIAALAVTDAKINDVAASKLTGTLGVNHGGTGADMSASGGANFLVKQSSAGGVLSSALMVLADIPNTLITLAKMALGTAGKIMGYDSSGAAAEIDRASDDVVAIWGETMSLNAAVIRRNSDDRWYKEDTDDATRLGAIRGIVVDLGVSGGATASTGFVRRLGPLGGLSSLTNGETLYATTTPGTLTQTLPAPTLDGAVVVVAPHGYATGTTTAYINALQEIIYRQFVTVAAAAVISITHYSDPSFARRIQIRSVIYTDVLTDTYASSNRDTDVSLRGAAGGTTLIDSAGVGGTFIGNQGGTIRRIAQSFSVSTAQRLLSFIVDIGPSSPFLGALGLDWRIETDNTDKPSGTVIASGTTAISYPPISGSTTNTITITGAPWLVASTKYWFVLQNRQLSPGLNVNYSIYINTTGAYANGSLKADTLSGGVFPGTWATFGGTNDLRASFVTSTSDALAQSFTASQTAVLTRVRLWLKKTGSPTGPLTAALYSNNAGVPGSLITNGTSTPVLASSLSTSYGYTDFLFYVPPPSITSGTIYHIVLTTTDAASSTNYVEWGADSSSPSFTGDMSVLTGATWNTIAPAADAVFEVYGRDTAFIRDMPLSDYDTGTAGYGVALGDSASANQDTITRIKNLGIPRELYINLTLP